MANYVSKTGTVEYTVITDTHGYVRGSLTADFDLGDNTTSGGSEHEPIQTTNVTKFAILGNHDVAQLMHQAGIPVEDTNEETTVPLEKEWAGLKYYYDVDHKVLIMGLDSARTFHKYRIPSGQITEVAQRLSYLDEDWDVIILTHVPLFPAVSDVKECWGPDEQAKWDHSPHTMKSANDLLIVLAAFQAKSTATFDGFTYDYTTKSSNNVIGCFAGHIHNEVVYIASPIVYPEESITSATANTKIYMETFRTNGAEEYTKSRQHNAGMYDPVPSPCTISINFNNKTVNGASYVSPVIGSVNNYAAFGQSSGKEYGISATGIYKMQDNTTFYPKFYGGLCVGYSEEALGGATESGDNHFTLGNVYVHGLNKYVRRIRFSANGKLRYYIEAGSSEQRTIPNYTSAQIRFLSDNGIKWQFSNGRFVSYTDTEFPWEITSRSGEIIGKNGYSIVFNDKGLATSVKRYNVIQSYDPGDNWINVSTITVYHDPVNDTEDYDWYPNAAQIGITGTFGAGIHLDMMRSTINGPNVMSTDPVELIRVRDENGGVFWFYDGVLTTLTDENVGI